MTLRLAVEKERSCHSRRSRRQSRRRTGAGRGWAELGEVHMKEEHSRQPGSRRTLDVQEENQSCDG